MLHEIFKLLICLLCKFLTKTSDFAFPDELELATGFSVLIEAFCLLNESIVVARWIQPHGVNRQMFAQLINLLLRVVFAEKVHCLFNNMRHVQFHVFVEQKQNIWLVAFVPKFENVVVERRINNLIREKSSREVFLSSFVSNDVSIVVEE